MKNYESRLQRLLSTLQQRNSKSHCLIFDLCNNPNTVTINDKQIKLEVEPEVFIKNYEKQHNIKLNRKGFDIIVICPLTSKTLEGNFYE